jgi:hypothetical protein
MLKRFAVLRVILQSQNKRVIPGECVSMRPGTQNPRETLVPGSRDALPRLAGMTRFFQQSTGDKVDPI